MRNLLALFSAVVLLFAGVGWYRGRYRVQQSPAPAGHHAVNIDIDKDKIGKDLQNGEEELQKAIEKRLNESGSKRADKASPDIAPPSPAPNAKPEAKIPRAN